MRTELNCIDFISGFEQNARRSMPDYEFQFLFFSNLRCCLKYELLEDYDYREGNANANGCFKYKYRSTVGDSLNTNKRYLRKRERSVPMIYRAVLMEVLYIELRL